MSEEPHELRTATGTTFSPSGNLHPSFSTPLTVRRKKAALSDLFKRIAPVARDMGGRSYLGESDVAFEAAIVSFPRTERAPSLHVEIPSGLVADFAPSRPLSVESVLLVQARRWLRVSRIADRAFTFLNGGWLYLSQPLTEDHVRQCLTLEGPPLSL